MMNFSFRLLALLMLLLPLAACTPGSADAPADDSIPEATEPAGEDVSTPQVTTETEPTPEASIAADPSSTPTPIPPPNTEPTLPAADPETKTGDTTLGDVTIEGVADLTLVGTFQASGYGPNPTVLLLHMLGSNRNVWADFAALLNENGYNTLALDMRGHGETGSTQDWTLAEDDLVLVWEYLAARPDVDENRIAVIGASIGANMALITGANIPGIHTVILLSPGLDYRGVQTEAALTQYGDRPLLIIASREDSYAASSSETLSELAIHTDSALHLYDGAGHGTNMLDRAEDLGERLLAWLAEHL